MRYYILEQQGNIILPPSSKGDEAEIIQASNVSLFAGIDYDAGSRLISDRLKNVIELYMPSYDFQPVVYLDTKNGEQSLFWKFRPPLYSDFNASYKKNGVIISISFNSHGGVPPAFTARSPKGVRFVIVKMPLAESVLRRSILGLKFTHIKGY